MNSKTNVAQLAFLVANGQVPKTIEYLFNDVADDDRRSVFYGSIASLINMQVSPQLISLYRDMVRGCAYDCGLSDPNVQNQWTDEDHVLLTKTSGESNVTEKSYDGIALNCRTDREHVAL